ncbi:hypothetical protein MRX96_016995 [Rhipicephalus microplus]
MKEGRRLRQRVRVRAPHPTSCPSGTRSAGDACRKPRRTVPLSIWRHTLRPMQGFSVRRKSGLHISADRSVGSAAPDSLRSTRRCLLTGSEWAYRGGQPHLGRSGAGINSNSERENVTHGYSDTGPANGDALVH